MSETAGDFLMQRLTEWGIQRIFGYPGDGINGLISAIDRTEGKIDFIQVRHEEQAAFMASAHAKFTRELGVCLATSGPGAIHLLNGLYDAKMDHQPVLAIVGQASTMALGGSYQQEVDLNSLFKDVASEYCFTVSNPAAMRHVVDRAIRIAMATRSVTCVIVPKDVAEMEAIPNPGHIHNTVHTGVGFSYPRILPRDEDLQRAAAVLNEGSKVALLVGAGAMYATDEVIALADRLGAGAAKALLGKAVLPDDLPWVTGTIGLLGTRPSNDMMNECDTLLMIGSTFPYGEFLPKEGQARGVQIDVKTAAVRAHPINPALLFLELSRRLPDNCILSGDAGTATNWLARYLQMRRGMKFALSGSLATMGPAVPYAIAAKFAYPDRVAIAMTGDGAMQMNGINELITVAKYWKRWSDPRIIFLILNNRDLNQVSWEMRVENGDPKFDASQDLPDFPYARYAELLGFKGIRVDEPKRIGAAWDEALSADRPVVIEAITDPDVSILPPHISFKQAKNLMTALVKDDPDRKGIIIEGTKEVLAEIFHGITHRH